MLSLDEKDSQESDIRKMKVKKNNLEEQISKLESLVQKLESGELNLDEGLESFEEGVKIYKSCRQLLSETEKKIKVLTDSLKEVDY